MHRLLLLSCLLAACSSLSKEDAQRLATIQQSASLNWESGDLQSTNALIDRGLEIAPDDYKLNTLRGMVLLRQFQSARPGPKQDALLDRAVAQFDSVLATRSMEHHDRQVLLGYGMAYERLGIRHFERADGAKTDADRAADAEQAAKRKQDAAEHKELGIAALRKAKPSFATMRDNGELLMLAHYHLMQVDTLLSDYEATFKDGDAYLKQAQSAETIAKSRIGTTTVLEYEQFVRQELERVKGEEMAVRSVLAKIHFDRKEYDLARQHLDVILAADPASSENYYNRGKILLALGRVDDAKSDFRKFMALSPLPASSDKRAEAVRALGMQ